MYDRKQNSNISAFLGGILFSWLWLIQFS